MLRHFLALGAFMLLLACELAAQTNTFTRKPVGFIYNTERSTDFRVQTFGWHVGMSFGKLRTFQKTPFYTISIGELRNHKETKNSYDFSMPGLSGQTTRPYILGKQQNLFVIRLGYGLKQYRTEKTTDRGVGVGTVLEGGFTLGLLKPYYLYMRRVDETNQSFRSSLERYTEENAEDFVDPFAVQGAGGFWKGVSQITPTPGAHARAGLVIDSGAYDEMVRAIELGLMVDFFPKAPSIMVNDLNSNLFVNLYLSLQLGRRQ
jgi:hypothetical protein